MRITVITPSYQQARFLPWTIRSVLGQDYPDIEYMIVDGGSTDGSVSMIKSVAHKLAWWCSEADRGQAHAINKGFERATGEVVGWLNSDDMLLPGALRCVAEAFQNPAVMAICGWGVMMSEDGRIRRKWVFPDMTADAILDNAPIFQPSVFWRRSLFDRIGLLDESMRFCLDREYWVRMVQRGIIPRTLPRCIAAYRKHESTKTNQIADVGAAELLAIQARVGNRMRPEFAWRWRAAILRLLHQKLLILSPPWSRGKSVHDFYGTSGFV